MKNFYGWNLELPFNIIVSSDLLNVAKLEKKVMSVSIYFYFTSTTVDLH